MDDSVEFEREKVALAGAMARDAAVKDLENELLTRIDKYNYTYQATWLGLPIIQSPADIVAQQECIWKSRPTVIIETGIARGGSLIFLASMLKLTGGRKVIGIDVDLRPHNRDRIESHPLKSLITTLDGSSTDEKILEQVREILEPNDRVMVILDSNHTHEHVSKELQLYSQLVSEGHYLVVADTVVECIPEQMHRPRPWGKGNNPMTALTEFLAQNAAFIVDEEVDRKLILSCNPRGYLLRTSVR